MVDAFIGGPPCRRLLGHDDAESLYVDDVCTAIVDVDEQVRGRSDGGHRSGSVQPTSGRICSTPFIVDRPFFFFIRDASGVVLFIGRRIRRPHKAVLKPIKPLCRGTRREPRR